MINNRADLEALRGTPAFAGALKALAGAVVIREDKQLYPHRYGTEDYIGPTIEPAWRHRVDESPLARLDMTPTDLNAEMIAEGLEAISLPADEGDILTQADIDQIEAAGARLPNIEAWRFHSQVALTPGLSDQIEAAMASLPEPAQTVARKRYETTIEFRFDDALLDQLRRAAGLDDAAFRSLWQGALDLPA